jgi:hypothetical protein
MKPISKKMRAMPASIFNLAGIVWIMLTIGAMQFALSVYPYADKRLSISDNIKKISLVQEAMAMPDSINEWDQKDLEILLRQPQIKRDEVVVTSWHYHGESCALDIFFDAKATTPDYIEFRPLSLNKDVDAQYQSADSNMTKLYCLRDVLQAQGVDTPASYARQPLPSWESPYRT